MSLSATASVRSLVRRAKSNNVAAMLEGTERPQEYVVYMAHWDHLGRALALGGDTIYNGAVDNATGIAALLSIARAYRELSPPRRSIVFLAVTAEEDGTIGSDYYADNPIVPLEKTVAMFNMDGFYPWGRAKDVEVVGFGASQLEDLLIAAAQRQDRAVSPDPVPEKGFFYRSDHFGLAKKGVPALYVKSGMDLRAGGTVAGRAWLEDYYAKRYHKPGDQYDESWDVSGCLEDVRLLFEVGSILANGSSWPNWYEGNEFRATRDASAAARR
jgi:Zn-dependent M28 family amino/carboxypeptidase